MVENKSETYAVARPGFWVEECAFKPVQEINIGVQNTERLTKLRAEIGEIVSGKNEKEPEYSRAVDSHQEALTPKFGLEKFGNFLKGVNPSAVIAASGPILLSACSNPSVEAVGNRILLALGSAIGMGLVANGLVVELRDGESDGLNKIIGIASAVTVFIGNFAYEWVGVAGLGISVVVGGILFTARVSRIASEKASIASQNISDAIGSLSDTFRRNNED